MSSSSPKHSGAMIALVPTEVDLDRLALDGGEPRDELHLTLWFLGDAANVDEETREALHNAVTSMIERRDLPTVQARAFGVGHWNPAGDDPAWVLNVGDVTTDERDNESLDVVKEMMREAWFDGGVIFEPPPQHSPWQPHVCVSYSTEDVRSELEARLGDVTFDRVRVAFGGDVTDLALALPATVAAALGGRVVPWSKVKGHVECSAGEPWAVVKDATGEVEGCHVTEEDANAQLAALYASENDTSADGETAGSTREASSVTSTLNVANTVVTYDVPVVTTTTNAVTLAANALAKSDDCPGDQHRMPDGSCMSDDEMYAASTWSGPLVVEGTPTGDGREFAPDALSWVEGALLRWQKEGSHGGDHDVTVSVGRIDRVWRDGNKIMGAGVLDLLNPDGFELRRRMSGGFAGGISIDADDIEDADVEFVWPESEDTETDGDGDVLKLLFGRPEKMIYHDGRVRAATVCDIPAFVEAYISLTNGELAEVVADGSIGRAFAVHSTETSDEPWNGHRRRQTHSREPLRVPDAAFAWVDGATQRFLHHEFVGDEVGSANVTACATGIAEVNARRALGDVTNDERRAVYEHLATHLRDADQEPPPLVNVEPLVAAAVTELVDRRPSHTWFEDPQLTVPIGITVTDQGRVYGHVAQWGECHIGFEDACVAPPHESSHPYFMTGEVVCADGSHVAVGQITVGTGHAPLNYRASRAAEHYDHTGSAVADVVVGNDAIGIWVAGAVRPHAEAGRVHDLRASGQVSGDWRRIGGELRLVGLLAVNVPGFPVPRLRARVASGVPVAMVAAGRTVVASRVASAVPTSDELDKLAMRRIMNILARRVQPSDDGEGAD